MIVRNDYSNCLTNLTCSIQKYFGLDYKHKTLTEADEILNTNNPKNVVILLFDGMGSKILAKAIDEDSFFRKHMVKELTSVFPPTTVAATTSVQTGLNPVEHGWLGWDVYMPNINKTATMFRGCQKWSDTLDEEILQNKETVYKIDTVVEQVNRTENSAVYINPWGEEGYTSLDDMLQKIKDNCVSEGKRFMYVYDPQPDHDQHSHGAVCQEAIDLIKERNDKVEQFAKDLKDTVIFIIADHGHIDVEDIYIDEYPDIFQLIERPLAIEPRAASIKVKEGCEKQFEELFDKYFGQYFSLYTKQQVIEGQLFGDGQPHPLFADSIQDYVAVAEKVNKCFMYANTYTLVSQHAGVTDDELYVPLIVVDGCK